MEIASAIQRRGLLFILSSPSGAGKSTIARMLLASDDGEAHGADGAHVARAAVHQRAGGAARLGGCGEQLAPGRYTRWIGAGEHGDLVGLQAVDECDLKLVRVGAGLVVIDLHEGGGTRATDHDARLVERSDARGQRLMHEADRVEAVGQHGNEQLFAHGSEGDGGHGGLPVAGQSLMAW